MLLSFPVKTRRLSMVRFDLNSEHRKKIAKIDLQNPWECNSDVLMGNLTHSAVLSDPEVQKENHGWPHNTFSGNSVEACNICLPPSQPLLASERYLILQ